jgi:hypothetical protein
MDVLAVGARLGVHIAGGVEERGDLLRGVEVGPARLGPPDAAALALRDVAIDQLALRSGLEQRAEQVSVMLIDRGPSVPSASFVAL